MAILLQSIDSAPLYATEFDFAFTQWVANLVDTLNEVITAIENSFNTLSASSYTSAEIAALAASLPNGVVLYDTTLNVYVGKENGTLVKFVTTTYP